MKLFKKHTNNETGFWRARDFLRQMYILNDLKPISWHISRLDYWKWHISTLGSQMDDLHLTIWETADREIAAAMMREEKAHANLMTHPAYNTPELVEEMVSTAEEEFYGVTKENKKKVYVWSHDHDKIMNEILEKHDFQKVTEDGWTEHQHIVHLSASLPDFETAAGYTIRSLGGPEEIPSRSWASWRAFHPNEPDEKYEGYDWYPVNIQQQPLYRRDLDIVAIAPDGSVAAFTTLWYDDASRSANFEPVGTVPEHQRKGLGKAVILEGMRRVKNMGAQVVSVSGFSEPANKLYSAMFGDECLLYVPWVKEWVD